MASKVPAMLLPRRFSNCLLPQCCERTEIV